MLYAILFVLAFFCYAEPATAPALSFDHDAEVGLSSDECSICFCSLKDPKLGAVVVLVCGGQWEHIFHKKCIDHWLETVGRKDCPICRRIVTKESLCACWAAALSTDSKKTHEDGSVYPRERVDGSCAGVRRCFMQHRTEALLTALVGGSIFVYYSIISCG